MAKSDERRVVVTGLGMVTPLGDGVGYNWSKITAGESGLRKIEDFSVDDIPAKVAGQPPRGEGEGQFNVDHYLLPKEQRKMDDFIIYAVCAAQQAVEDSGWLPEREEDCVRTFVMIGSGIGGILSAVLGVGAGVIYIPLLRQYTTLKTRATIGTSLGIMMVVVPVAVIAHGFALSADQLAFLVDENIL